MRKVPTEGETSSPPSDVLRYGALIAFWAGILLAIAHLSLGIYLGSDRVRDIPVGVALYLALALVALVLPYIVKAKLPGGIEIELGIAMALNSSNNKLKTLEAKLSRITEPREEALPGDEDGPSPTLPKLPPVKDAEDQQRGRFGGKAKSNGLHLSAKFEDVGSQKFVRVILKVASETAEPLAREVRFYLHETFDPDEVVVSPRNGVASLDLLAYGGFTVGAWISAPVETFLELDLSKVRGAPRIIRDL